MKWISVTDNNIKPIPNEWYLVWREDGRNIGTSYLVWDYPNWIEPISGSYFIRNKVTHWLKVTSPKDTE